MVLNFDNGLVEESHNLQADDYVDSFTLSNSWAKYGYYSARFEPMGKQYSMLLYELPHEINTDFTLHGWFYVETFPKITIPITGYPQEQDYLFLRRNWNGVQYTFGVTTQVLTAEPEVYINKIYIILPNEPECLFFDNILTVGTPFHLALVRTGYTAKFYVNGVLFYTHTEPNPSPYGDNPSTPWGFNQWDIYNRYGGIFYADGIELVLIAKWTSDFTPPTFAPFVEKLNIIDEVSTETITVSDNSLISSGDTLTITGVDA